MGSFATRFVMGLLVALQSVHPVMACECEPYICWDCDCQTVCDAGEPCVDYSVKELTAGGVCECEAQEVMSHEQADTQSSSPAKELVVTKPKKQLPTPASETPTPVTPPPPIAVPQPDNELAPPTNDLFPGPAGSADKPPAVSPPEKKSEIDSLFEEPSAISEPQPSPSKESTTPKPNSTEALFVEPKQETEQPPTSESPEASELVPVEESNQEPENKSDSFEDLFGPVDGEPEPKEEAKPEPFDPFSQEGLPPKISSDKDLASTESRVWTDSSAEFSCEARLVSLTSKLVLLQSVTGNRISIHLSRLSDADLTFLQEYVHAQRMVLARESLAAQLASSWSH
ncbi:SHD1 domain-containing protein [Bythopirellula polymerisocia]|uniref:SLA1 homology domain-containing protein n=1 Tax=Bythopirellula polymerisocia TaxID=2528003 RepID=A0A5C6CMY1_9BACT|nr:SHD1 domain-containing protein [Bythopirellula polymerisocia]TWU25752.1 hypothetical protein Pla144_29640 [Bythopirellula polymerisocia]